MFRSAVVLFWFWLGLAMAQGGPVVAVVGPTVITKGQFDLQFGLFVRDLLRRQGQPYTPEAEGLFVQLRPLYLRRMAQDRAVILAAEQAGLAAREEAVRRAVEESQAEFESEAEFAQALEEAGVPGLETYRALVYEVLTYEAYLEHLGARLQFSEGALRALYLLSKSRFELPRRYCSAHILLKTAQEARRVIQRLAQGENFADLAKELSQDPGSRAVGGSLGCEPRGTYVAPFERALLGLKPGEVTKTPVQTEYGFHVIQLLRVEPPGLQPFAEARGSLLTSLRDQALQSLLTSVVQRTPIRLFPENL
ncbi:MAG: peptidylprolyl isomerase [Meiothermus sp.]|uniref:peptidylprolyl isomerase n=1 Tax=Meiothermus sp. TaxID=1955249 RepID=UPI0025E542E1|nr:peptidylprolyl isomerase [Meiothermus sp.]MCS7195517.1 peptidylprolyl isomerase [Meiothermus sp.]MCX7741584.1 peptidylprolyl isomerase [Meiothermus sp.]MDW8090445.1 peptidylprolyl isomerase [Meiothermus sp.]